MCSNKRFPILHSEIEMAPCKLEAMPAILIFEKVLVLNYLIIIVKVYESMFESWDVHIKFKVWNNRYKSKTAEFVVPGYMKGNLTFTTIT